MHEYSSLWIIIHLRSSYGAHTTLNNRLVYGGSRRISLFDLADYLGKLTLLILMIFVLIRGSKVHT
jgi:hypothetical protein